MKVGSVIVLFLLITSGVLAQGKANDELVRRTELLINTVFGTKDSLTLEHLFAKNATYGHSNGKVEERDEAIRNIFLNPSVYADTAIDEINVKVNGNTALVRHSFKATETKKDGKSSNLNLGILLIWIREKGEWKLFGRQAIKLG